MKEKFCQEKDLSTNLTGYWHSRTIAIVADADTGIIVTGATKPVAPKIPILEQAAHNISHIRVGEEFGSIVNDCSNDVWKLVSKIKGKLNELSDESTILYDKVVNAQKDSVASYQNIPSSRTHIMCWAFNTDFELQAPCTRCQRLYSGWILHKFPETPEEKLEILRKDKRIGSLKYSSGFTYPCGYCAETVAAAKLHALKHGILALILPKDTDKIKASDEVQTPISS